MQEIGRTVLAMRKRARIEDVARLAGVSKGTVSSVLNGRGAGVRISSATADRVRRAAHELSYSPSALGRMLARNRADSIGLLFQYADHFHATSSFIPVVMRSVCEACTDAGVDLILFTKPSHDSKELVQSVTDGRVDGCLALRDAGDPLTADLVNAGLPLVQFYSRCELPGCAYVDTDNFTGGRIATRHLIELGHKKIGMIRAGSGSGSTASQDRHSGFRDALESEGLEYRPEWVIDMASLEKGAEPLRRSVTHIDRPTAFFVWSDDVAMGCMRVLMDLGLKVPDDISIIGFDSTEACEQTIPRLTSVRQPVAAIAREATKLLLSLVNCEPVEQIRLLFPPDLDVRDSTAPPQESAQSPKKKSVSTKRSP